MDHAADSECGKIGLKFENNNADQKTTTSLEFIDNPSNSEDEEQIENIGELFQVELPKNQKWDDLKETKKNENRKDFVSEDSPWYEEEEDSIREFRSAKQLESEFIDMDCAFSFCNSKEDDLIGDFVKLDFSKPEDAKSSDLLKGDDVNLSKLQNLFGTPEILSLNENLELNQFEFEQPEQSRPPDGAKERPIIPDFEIDYDNIYENIAKVGEIEKQLQILYRPFTSLVDLNCTFRMYELAMLLDDARYEPAHHPALFLRLRNPSAEIRLYAGGKISSTALTADSARRALLKVIQIVEELGYHTEITHFSKNIVHASFCLPFKIDLEMLSELHSEQVSGNRETRPFVTYKIEGAAIRFAVFPNGYVLVLHAKQHSETRAAIAGFLPILAQFRNGFLTPTEKYGSLCGDISFKLLWERKLEEDKEGALLYS